MSNTDLKTAVKQLESALETYLVDKAPVSIPSDWKDIIVKILPWLTILGTLAAVQGVMSFLGWSLWGTQFGYGIGLRYGFMNLGNAIQIVIWGLTAVLEFISIPGLFKKQENSWRLLYYAGLVNAARSLLIFDLIGFAVGSLLMFYVLFQIKEYYK